MSRMLNNFPYDLDAGNQGFDGFAIDGDGKLVIIEPSPLLTSSSSPKR